MLGACPEYGSLRLILGLNRGLVRERNKNLARPSFEDWARAHHVRNWSFKVYCALAAATTATAGGNYGRVCRFRRRRCGRRPRSLVGLVLAKKCPKARGEMRAHPSHLLEFLVQTPQLTQRGRRGRSICLSFLFPLSLSSFLYSRFRIGHTQAFTSHAIVGS